MFYKESKKILSILMIFIMVVSTVFSHAVFAEKKNVKASTIILKKPTINTLTLKCKEKYKLSTTILPKNVTKKNLTYKSSQKKVASVSKSGIITAKKAGTVKITVISNSNKKVKNTLKVLVVKKLIKAKSVKLLSVPKTLYINGTKGTNRFSVRAQVLPLNATNKKLVYISSQPKVVAVETDGTVSALRIGKTVITVYASDGRGAKKTFTVSVEKAQSSVKTTSPEVSAIPSPTYSILPTATSMVTSTPTPKPEVSPSATPTRTSEVLPSATPTRTPVVSPSATPTQTPVVSPSATPTQTPIVSSSPTPTPIPVELEIPFSADMNYTRLTSAVIADAPEGGAEITFPSVHMDAVFKLPETYNLANYSGMKIECVLRPTSDAAKGKITFGIANSNAAYSDLNSSRAGDQEYYREQTEAGNVTFKINFTCLPEDRTAIPYFYVKSNSSNMTSLIIKSVTFIPDKKEETEANLVEATTGDSLKDAFSKYFTMGVAISPAITINSMAVNMIKYQYKSITFENELKPEFLLLQTESQNDPNGYPCIDEAGIDRLLTFAKNNNLPVRGHTLVWHAQTPEWFFRENYNDTGNYVSKVVMRGRLEQYIKKVVTYCQTNYPDTVYAWDVVNEAISDEGGYRDASSSNWYRVYGDESYIEDAFRFARMYTQGTSVKLFYNDYNTYSDKKMDTISAMVKDFYEKGLLDGMGMQSHVGMDYPDANRWKNALLTYGAIGLEIHITEMDIQNTESNETILANRYETLFRTLLEVKKSGKANITNVTFWGLNDAESCLNGGQRDFYPLLFNGVYKKKEAYERLIALASDFVLPTTTQTPVVSPTSTPYSKPVKLEIPLTADMNYTRLTSTVIADAPEGGTTITFPEIYRDAVFKLPETYNLSNYSGMEIECVLQPTSDGENGEITFGIANSNAAYSDLNSSRAGNQEYYQGQTETGNTTFKINFTCLPEDRTAIPYFFVKCNSSNMTSLIIKSLTFIPDETEEIKANLADATIGDSLKDAFSKYFTMGAAITESCMTSSSILNMIKHQYNSITHENELKPEFLLLQTESQNDLNGYPCIDESRIDRFLTFAKNNNLPVRGHTLVWHAQTPEWFFRENYNDTGNYVSKSVMRGRLEQYIKKVVTYCQINYSDTVYAWDVVNEAISDEGGYRDASSSSWYRVYGDESYIEDAFRFARMYTQGTSVKLFYNDYNTYSDKKIGTISAMVKDFYEKGLLDGMGMQSHVGMDYPDANRWKNALLTYGAIGLEIHITEIDVQNTDSNETILADRYETLFRILLEVKKSGQANITNVTFWGVNDAGNWLNGEENDVIQYPLLFNEVYKKKEAYERLIELASE